MSGPVLGTNNFGTAWGSAIGALVTWEPFDFGLRQASVAAATAARAQSGGRSQANAIRRRRGGRGRLRHVGRGAGDSPRGASRRGSRGGAFANDRRAGECPTAPRRRCVASPSGACRRTDATDSGSAGGGGCPREPLPVRGLGACADHGLCAQVASVAAGADRGAAGHGRKSALGGAERRGRAIEGATQDSRAVLLSRAFSLQGSAYARGTGAETNGTNLGGLNGLAPTTQNYALGFTCHFSGFRSGIDSSQGGWTIRDDPRGDGPVPADCDRFEGPVECAVATLGGARNVAANTPVQVAAARAATEQATARYQSGLGNIDEVAEAQRLLTQAEIDDALARLGVWRALLGVATAAGDIQPFVAEASQ